MKKFDAENYFLAKKDRVYNLAIFRQLHLLNNGC